MELVHQLVHRSPPVLSKGAQIWQGASLDEGTDFVQDTRYSGSPLTEMLSTESMHSFSPQLRRGTRPSVRNAANLTLCYPWHSPLLRENHHKDVAYEK